MNSSRDSGGMTLKECSTFEEAVQVYRDYRQENVNMAYEKSACEYETRKRVGEVKEDEIFKDITSSTCCGDVKIQEVVNEKTDKFDKQVFGNAHWKRPGGMQFLCVPMSNVGPLLECRLRTVPDNRTYDW